MSDAILAMMREDEFVAFDLASPKRHELVEGVSRR